MFIVIPPTTSPQPPAIVQECKYQVRIEPQVYKCLTEAEWQKKENARIASDAKTAEWAYKHRWLLIGITSLFVFSIVYTLSL